MFLIQTLTKKKALKPESVNFFKAKVDKTKVTLTQSVTV